MRNKKKVVAVKYEFVIYGIGRTKEEAIKDAYGGAFQSCGINNTSDDVIKSIKVIPYEKAIDIFGDPSILDEDN